MSLFDIRKKHSMPTPETALPGRTDAMPVPAAHFVNGNPLCGPFPEHLQQAVFGMGCFWGVERKFWQMPGVFTTAAGYAAGLTPNPTYHEVCSGRTGHNEVVLVVFDPAEVSYEQLLRVFWEGHDPTQGMRQGNDMGTQYRSGIYTFDDKQAALAVASREAFQRALDKAVMVPSPRRFCPPRRFITRRIITSSTWPKIPMAIRVGVSECGHRRPAIASKKRPDEITRPYGATYQV